MPRRLAATLPKEAVFFGVLTGLVFVVLVGGAVISAQGQRRDRIAIAASQLEGQAHVVASDVIAVTRVVQATFSNHANLYPTTGYDLHALGAAAEIVLPRALAPHPEVPGFVMMDAAGDVIANYPGPKLATNYSGPSYFKALSAPEAPLYFAGEPISSRPIGLWYGVPMAWRISDADGAMDGLLATLFRIDLLSERLARLLDPFQQAHLMRRDGTLITSVSLASPRRIHTDATVGEDWSGLFESPDGQITARPVDFYDQSQVLAAWAPIEALDIIVVMTAPSDIALASWREGVMRYFGIVFVAAVVLSVLMASVVRSALQSQAARATAEAADLSKSDFLAVISHEIRTPLNGLMGIAQLLDQSALDDRQRGLVKTLKDSGQTLRTLLNDLLDMAKTDAGRLELNTAPFSVRELIDGIGGMMSPRAEARGLEFVVMIESAVPSMVHGDPVRLRQVILNLLGSALKFTQEGRVSLSVTTEPDTKPLTLRFTITDTGIGIEERVRPKLFNAFIQADSSISRRYGGTGLGLQICKRLVNAMGGRIGFSSSLGHGSTFWITLPLPMAAVPRATKVAAPEPIQRRFKLLMAEDNAVNQMVGKQLLETRGHTVVLARDGSEAVELARTDDFDAILMDVQMPVMDGLEATRIILRTRDDAGGPPIIALTAALFEEQIERYLAVGMVDVIAKPLILTDIEQAVARAIAPD
jgi:signal transduction histidine kinase/ActR/RegA family two-component response regulator